MDQLLNSKNLVDLRSLSSRLRSGGLNAVVANIIRNASVLILHILLARVLEPTEYGIYFLMLSFVMTASIAGRFGMGFVVMRLNAEALANERVAELKWNICLTFMLMVISLSFLSAVLWFLREELALFFKTPEFGDLIFLVVAWVFLVSSQRYVADCLRGLKKIDKGVYFDGAYASLFSTIAIGAFVISGNSLVLTDAIVIVLSVLILIVIYGSGLILGELRALPVAKASGAGAVVALGGQLMVANLSTFSLTESAVLIVGATLVPEDVANYGVALKLIVLLKFSQFIVNSIVPPLIPELREQNAIPKLEYLLRSSASLVALIGVVVYVLFALVGGVLISFLFGGAYIKAYPVLLVLGLGQLANLSVGSCGQVLMMTGHQGTMMRIALLTLAFSIAAAFMVAPHFGTVGVAAVYAASTGLQGWVTLLAVRQKLGFYTHVKMITADDVRLVLENVRARK